MKALKEAWQIESLVKLLIVLFIYRHLHQSLET